MLVVISCDLPWHAADSLLLLLLVMLFSSLQSHRHSNTCI
jgi:hypothetical protein